MQISRQALKRPWLRGVALVLLAVVVGWFLGTRLTKGDASADHDTTNQIYRDIAGRIVRLAPDDGMMTVDHEEIKGLMPAMVMDLRVADWRELTGFSPGDDIFFDLVNLDGTIQAVRLRRADRDTSVSPHPDDSGPVDPLGRGDLVPDIELYDASGHQFRLREMEPRNKVITFFYVRCPLQDFCPTQSQRLAQVQKHTASSVSGVHLVSLTLDSDNDDPEALADYAKRFRADPNLWTLAGSEDSEAIRSFADRVGAQVERDKDGTRIDHALIALRVDGDRIVDFVYGIEAIEALIRAM